MLLQFSVGSFRSFNEVQTLDLEPAAISDFPEKILIEGDYKALPVIAVYGANASGKSNLISALAGIGHLLAGNSKLNSTDTFVEYQPFIFSEKKAPVFFELTFLLENVKYRYGVEFEHNRVVKEWLFETKKNIRAIEKPLFLREGADIALYSVLVKEGKDLEEKTNPNRLFLSVLDSFASSTANKLLRYFSNYLNVISGVDHKLYENFTASLLEDSRWKPILLDFYKNADLGFDDILVEKKPIDEQVLTFLSETVKKQLSDTLEAEIKTIHKVGNSTFNFLAAAHESSGTNKLLDLSGAIFDTLYRGATLIVDELDAKLHPLLTLSIIRLFHNKEVNTKNAQLIFATHDTNILEKAQLRRDQIYFTEKNKDKATVLYSLVAYKPRQNESFGKNYLEGRYGAIPYFGNISSLEEQLKQVAHNE